MDRKTKENTMKTRKVLALAGVTLLAAGVLAACSGSGSSAKGEKTFSYVYETDPDNLNYLTTGKAATTDITSNVIDGLLENDRYGNFVPSIAEDWSVSKDGLTYTYTIRKDAKWYTSEGEEYAPVKAQDFVTGLKYATDKKSEALYLVQDSIKGLDAYAKGETKDFSQVGIKAIDDQTVQYTLNKPESFWNSKTTMGVLAPVNEEFLNSKGDDFGKATDPSSILYNGPYLLKSLVAKSSVEFAKNPNYWDKDNVHIDKVKLSFWDGQDTGKLAENFKDGSFTMARLFPTSASYPELEKEFKDNIVYTPQDSTTYLVGTNIDRQSYKYTSKTTDEQKTSTKKALLNKDFRQALAFGFDRKAYASQVNGANGATKLLRNLFVPPTFVQADGKNFGEMVKDKLVTYGDEWKDVNLADAQDGLYNPEKAKAENAVAIGQGSVANEKDTVSVGNDGSNGQPIVNRRITNVATPIHNTDAVNKQYVDNSVNSVRNELKQTDKKLRGGIAGAVAMANIPTANRAGGTMIGLGVGNFKGQNAIAVGISRSSDNNRIHFKASGSANSAGDYAVGGGIGYQW